MESDVGRMCRNDTDTSTPAANDPKYVVFERAHRSNRRITRIPAVVTAAARRLATAATWKLASMRASLRCVPAGCPTAGAAP
jgi:hypothetical protein